MCRLLIICLLLTGCGAFDPAPPIPADCANSRWFAGYKWSKQRAPYQRVIVTQQAVAPACGHNSACVIPFADGNTAAMVLPPDADACLIAHETLHLLGWVHP